METVILKECIYHGLTLHSWRNNEKRYRCRKCNAEQVQKRRYMLKEKAVEYKGGKCSKCGYNKCIDALEFHHLDPLQKEFSIGQNGYANSWKHIQKELDKCIMVCANCHREIHSQKNKDLKDKIINKKNLANNYNFEKKYNENAEKIVDMKDKQRKSFYIIAEELKLARNTVMKYYKKYKK